jgi:hypothetical protein
MNHALVGLAAVALSCAPASAIRLAGDPQPTPQQQQGNQWSWHGRVPAGKTLEIKGVNGPITAEPASGDEVVVTAEKRARHSDPDEVRIEVVQDEGGVTICAVYPGRANRCGPDDDYHMSTHDNDVEVVFHAQIPRGVAFAGGILLGLGYVLVFGRPPALHGLGPRLPPPHGCSVLGLGAAPPSLAREE